MQCNVFTLTYSIWEHPFRLSALQEWPTPVESFHKARSCPFRADSGPGSCLGIYSCTACLRVSANLCSTAGLQPVQSRSWHPEDCLVTGICCSFVRVSTISQTHQWNKNRCRLSRTKLICPVCCSFPLCTHVVYEVTDGELGHMVHQQSPKAPLQIQMLLNVTYIF